MKHFTVLYSHVARKHHFAGRPCMEAVVARGDASFNSGASPTSDVMN